MIALTLKNFHSLCGLDPQVLIAFVVATVRRVCCFDTTATWRMVFAERIAVDGANEFGSRVSMEVRQPETVRRCIPSWPQPEEVHERSMGIARSSRQDRIN
jgi:hypothetical protein